MSNQIQIENLLFFRNTVSLNDEKLSYRIFTPVFQWDWYDEKRDYVLSINNEHSAGVEIPEGAFYVRLTVWGKLSDKFRLQLTQTRLIEIPVK